MGPLASIYYVTAVGNFGTFKKAQKKLFSHRNMAEWTYHCNASQTRKGKVAEEWSPNTD